jgi:hypothetical protein
LLGLTYRHAGRGWRYAKTDQHMLMTARVGYQHNRLVPICETLLQTLSKR